MRALLLISGFLLTPGCAQDDAQVAAQLRRWGDETLAAIRRDFRIPESGLYAERIGEGNDPRQPAFMWGCGVQLSALAAAGRLDPGTYKDELDDFIERLDSYWHVTADRGGYDVQPRQRSSDRYYDDNAWIVLALVDAYDATGRPNYLDRAAAAQRFVMSGEDDRLGGGLYWRENERESKHTCANAPGIVGALLLYQRTGEPAHLQNARRLFDWTRSHLQDPEDGLFWDAIRLDGTVDRRKFTYNSAVMIRANCLMYEITKERPYLDEAVRISRAAIKHWVDPISGAVRDAGHFAHMLLEALLEVGRRTGEPGWRDTVMRSVRFVHDELRDADGRYPNRWHLDARRGRRGFQLLDQASVARLYFAAARRLQTGAPDAPRTDRSPSSPEGN